MKVLFSDILLVTQSKPADTVPLTRNNYRGSIQSEYIPSESNPLSTNTYRGTTQNEFVPIGSSASGSRTSSRTEKSCVNGVCEQVTKTCLNGQCTEERSGSSNFHTDQLLPFTNNNLGSGRVGGFRSSGSSRNFENSGGFGSFGGSESSRKEQQTKCVNDVCTTVTKTCNNGNCEITTE